MKTIRLNCSRCELDFEKSESQYRSDVKKGYKRFFCSTDCYLNTRKDESVANLEERECEHCEKTFARRRAGKGDSLRFCSRACASRFNNGARTKLCREENCSSPVATKYGSKCSMHTLSKRDEKIKLWLSGDNSATLTSGKYTTTKRFVKEHLIEVRGDRCESCGFNQKAPDGRSIIQMDHVNGNCFDNRPENLKLLCPNCHAMTPTYGSLNKGSGRSYRRRG